MIFKKTIFAIASGLAIATLSGCSTLGVGKSEFACEAGGSNTKCGVSARDLYKLSEQKTENKKFKTLIQEAGYSEETEDSTKEIKTEKTVFGLEVVVEDGQNDTFYQEEQKVEVTSAKKEEASEISYKPIKNKKKAKFVAPVDSIANTPLSAFPNEKTTAEFVLKRPEVIRIWIAPYVNEKQVLSMGVYKYADVKTQKWFVGNSVGSTVQNDVMNVSRFKPFQVNSKDIHKKVIDDGKINPKSLIQTVTSEEKSDIEARIRASQAQAEGLIK
jgi:hypothetical protein